MMRIRMRTTCIFQTKMAASSVVVSESLLEDKIADIWPDYPCLYDVRSRDFKNRDLRVNQCKK